jgi:plastocyanin
MSAVRKRTWPLAAALAIVGGSVALGVPAPAPAAEGPQVLMVDNDPDLTRWHYDPATVTVPAGATVVWLNKGKEDHSVTADDRSFDSGLKKSGATFSRVFPRPGTYTYHCQPHPWMKGLIEVKAAAALTPTSAATSPPSSTPVATEATAPAQTPESTTPAAPETPATAPDAPAGEAGDEKKSDDKAAASASDKDKGSGGHLAGNLALVLLPTLVALALGAKLRQSRS